MHPPVHPAHRFSSGFGFSGGRGDGDGAANGNGAAHMVGRGTELKPRAAPSRSAALNAAHDQPVARGGHAMFTKFLLDVGTIKDFVKVLLDS